MGNCWVGPFNPVYVQLRKGCLVDLSTKKILLGRAPPGCNRHHEDDVNNVPKIEIDKFESDITHNNCCGILLPQTSGIAN